MSKAAQSVLVFAVYLFVIGAILVAAPNLLLSLLLIPATHEVWIRVVGMLVLILGYYYLTAARGEMTGFFRATVHARFAVLVFFVAFIVLRLAPPLLLVFGVIDALAATWTALALRERRGW